MRDQVGRVSTASSRDESLKAVFAAAFEHHRQGRLELARQYYSQVLSQEPQHADSLHLLGVIANQTGQPDLAVNLIDAAIARRPNVAAFYVNLSNAFRVLRRFDEAVAALRVALSLNGGLADAHLCLGTILADCGRPHEALQPLIDALELQPDKPDIALALGDCLREQGRLADAEIVYRRALSLDPTSIESLNKLGGIRQALGCPSEAEAFHTRSVALDPNDPASYNHLGTALSALGRLDEASRAYASAIRCDPAIAESYYNLGNVFVEMERFDDGVAYLRTALERQPDFVPALYNLGNALRLLGQSDEATRCLARVLELDPDVAEAHNNIGILSRDDGHYDEAITSFRRALDLKPDFADAWNNLGNALGALGDTEGGIASLREAVRLRPNFADAHQNLGMALLAAGEYGEGWSEYEWRWQTAQMRKARPLLDASQWDGKPGHGRVLLVHAEQGFGDTIQFCRFIPLVAQRDLRIILEVPAPLVRLLSMLSGAERIIAANADRPRFDLHCPMLSLPLALGTTLDTVPSSPYLCCSDRIAARWRDRIEALGKQGRRVGLVWAGNPRLQSAALAALDRRRSIPPNFLEPLSGVPSLIFFSLQKDAPAAPAMKMVDWMGEMHDFADTAGLVANLDLVISVDTAVAHLAAALGKPVWLLDRYDPCWRWLRGRADSPWYPTMRIYRQDAPGEWGSVVAEVTDDLQSFALSDRALIGPNPVEKSFH